MTQAHTAPHSIPQTHRSILSLCFATLALSACGGGSGSTASSTQTTIQGAVVKGPVSGSTVCAYAVQANAKSTPLGSCVTTDASGNYTLAVTTDVGKVVWLEASGGTYTDEATGAPATLASGNPLRTIITANNGSVSSMLTPLTTLALNAAAAAVGSTGSLNANAFSAAATQLLSTFSLPAGLDIATTLPAFGSGLNAYGEALTAISQMVADGTPLANILATVQPSDLAAAYTAAASSPVTTPPATSGGGSPSANGTLTAAGTVPEGISPTFAPDATAFKIAVSESATTYTFSKLTSASADFARVEVTVPTLGNTTVAYSGRRSITFCASACGVTISTASGSTHPVTLTFNATPLSPLTGGTSTLTLTGNLVGDAPGAAWRVADLPGAINSTLSLSGTSVRVLIVSDNIIEIGGAPMRSTLLSLSDGSQLVLSRTGTAAATATRIVPPFTQAYCTSACGVTLSDTTADTSVTFANTTLIDGTVVNGTVNFAKTGGSLTSSDSGSFTPINSNVTSLNSTRTITFSVLGTPAQAGLSTVTVDVQDGRVISAAATVGIATQVMHCFDNGSFINVPACTGISVAADGRTVTFTNAVLYGGAVGATTKRNVTFNGTLVAKGP